MLVIDIMSDLYLLLMCAGVRKPLQHGACPPIRHHHNDLVTADLTLNGCLNNGKKRLLQDDKNDMELLDKIGMSGKNSQTSAETC